MSRILNIIRHKDNNKLSNKHMINKILFAVWLVMFLDWMCFGAWILSGQTPVDGFYLGRITAEIIKILM